MSELLDPALGVVVFPLVTFAIIVAAGRWLPLKGALPGLVATGGSLGFSLWIATQIALGSGPTHETVYTFIGGLEGEGVALSFGLLVDPLSALMLVVVSLVAFLVHLFSVGYMNSEGEPDLDRYYAGLSLFTFSMLAFVVSDNLLMSFVFFELVGLCSFLLIGHWFREEGPPSAAKKAFLVTRFGDYFFLIGVVAVFATFGTAAFAGPDSFVLGAQDLVEGGAEYSFLDLSGQQVVDIIGLLVLGGVLGKSAQFPLHTWLPDAMEGPTPVSALIHAATMVAAGVYLVARMYGFYALSPTVLAVLALVGGFTALFAATMALVKQELKQVLAYSTISQYGYMMLALGGGGYVAAVFHLTTHAIFKALLFLGAGAVIVAMHHEENMWEMGGLKAELPVTYYTFLAGSLALAGVFPFAGFWSKDEVLFETLDHALGGADVLFVAYALGLVAVVVTALYTFRMVLLTFHGEPRTDQAADPDPVSLSMRIPLVVLGALSVVAGVLNLGTVKEFIGEGNLFLKEWLDGATLDGFGDLGTAEGEYVLGGKYYVETLLHDFAGYELAGTSPLVPGVLALVVALAGLAAAIYLYRDADPEPHMTRLGPVRTVLANNYYQDEYQVWLARNLTLPVALGSNRFDQGIIDGIVNGTGAVTGALGARFRRIQTGVVSNYAALLVLGLVLLLAVFGIAEGWWF
jgi:NADH-quinone oxidoreductase subunit L